MDIADHITNTCSFEVFVRDCELPTIHRITATPDVLWPPNHKMEPVTLGVSATDNCDLAACKIISVTSNETGSRNGTGNTDWEITGDLTLKLRAERSGSGSQRIYSITIECTDDSGNSSRAVVHVTVPRRRQ